MHTVRVEPIEAVVEGVTGAPTDEQWDTYNTHTHEVAAAALAEHPDGIELRYPSGAFDRLRMAGGRIEAIPTSAAPVAEPDPDQPPQPEIEAD